MGTGLVDANVEGFEDADVWLHRALGIAVASCSTLSAILYGFFAKKHSPWMLWAARVLLFAAALLVMFSGHTGGELVYGEGYFL